MVESSGNVQMILRFFDMFLKLKDFTSSDVFRAYDPDCKGRVSRKDFQKATERCKRFSQAETLFLMSCMGPDDSEAVDYEALVDGFHEPAQDIGFSIAVLLTNLSEHMPNDSRLRTLLEVAESVLTHFQPFLGRIEILGGGKRIERVYFRISASSRAQWEKPQVKESKRQFVFDVVNESGDEEKMEMFVNFCEDTIFEMQLAAQLSGCGAEERRVEAGPEEKGGTGGPEGIGLGAAYRWLVLTPALFVKALMKMTVKDAIVFLRFVLAAQLGGALVLARAVLNVLHRAFLSGELIEEAKGARISEMLGGILEPTLDEVTGGPRGDGLRKASSSTTFQRAPSGSGSARTAASAGDVDVLSDVFGLTVRKEGSGYRLTSKDLTRSPTDPFSPAPTGAAASRPPQQPQETVRRL